MFEDLAFGLHRCLIRSCHLLRVLKVGSCTGFPAGFPKHPPAIAYVIGTTSDPFGSRSKGTDVLKMFLLPTRIFCAALSKDTPTTTRFFTPQGLW